MLVIAVIGGLYRLEGAWMGAFVFVVLDNWIRGIDMVGQRFNTVIGVIFLAIVLVSPGGLMGIWGSRRRAPSRFGRAQHARTRPLGPHRGAPPASTRP